MSNEKNWKTLRKPGELVKVWLLRNNVLGGGGRMARDFCTACPSTLKQSKEAACDSKFNRSDSLTANVNQRPVQSQVKAMTLN